MKKITAFFLAIMPIFITILLFASGLIVKSSTHVYVQSVQLDRNEQTVYKHSETKDSEFDLVAKVIPTNATNPELLWKTGSGTDDVLTVNNEGHVTCKNYGEEYVYAVSKENQTLAASCKVEVTDNQIHKVVVSDEDKYDVAYLGINQRKKINAVPVPSKGVLNPTIDFEVDSASQEYIEVAGDGTIIPKKETNGNKTKVKIHADKGDYTSVITEVDIQIGPGVQQVALKDETQSIVSSDTYDLSKNLYTFPETSFDATDFTYTSSDESIATIDANGVATFKDIGAATFTATYRRDTSLKVSKSVYSSFNCINDIHFNCDEYTQTIEYKDGAYVPATLDTDKFSCDVFPQANAKEATYWITSSDESVLKLTKGTDGKYTFTALRPGVVVLVAQAYTGASLTSLVNDACLVTITCANGAGLISKPTVTLEDGVYYYPLINSLNLQTDKRSPYAITYELSEGDNAYIDDNNILHFTDAGTAKVTVSIDGTEIGTISVTSKSKLTDLTITSGKDSYVIEVGQQYKIANGTPVFKGLLFTKSYAKYFDYTDEYFVAKNGCNISDFEITMSDGSTRYINLIVKEDPVCITSSVVPYFATTEVEYNFKKNAGCAIIPSTATKADGSSYSLTYTYDTDSEYAKVEDDNITFTAPALVEVTVSYDDVENHKLHSYLKSTYGLMSKFTLKDSSGNIVKSNSKYTYDGKNPLVFSVYDLTRSEANQIEAEVISQTELFDIKKEVISETVLGTIKEVRFTLTPKAQLYGSETIRIKNKVYSLYINVEISATITDFQVSYGREFLSSTDVNNSFASDLKLNILPCPALESTTKAGTYTVKLGGTELPVTNNTVSITDLTGEQNLEIYLKDASTPLKTFKLVKKDYADIDVSIIGANNDYLYMGAKETRKVLYLKANGLVEPEFWTKASNFKIVPTDPAMEKNINITQDIVTINNISDPDGTEYNLGLDLMYGEKKLHYYTLTRDIITKIVLPGFDNDDMTDKKGLQKVHVYGNGSYYQEEGGWVNYLKVNIKIFDYKSEEIVDLDKKAIAMKSLNMSINNNCSCEYDQQKGYLKIYIAVPAQYTPKEIATDAFDSKVAPKNTNLLVATRSNLANAKYTFVFAEGTNVFDEDGLKHAIKNNAAAVLHTNFGLDDTTSKESHKLDFEIGSIYGIYGNGYTICETWGFLNDKYTFISPYFINVNLQGCSSEIFAKQTAKKQHYVQIDLRDYKERFFSYSTYMNFSGGISAPTSEKDRSNIYISNSMFSNNKACSIEMNNEEDKVYIENCVFLNAGSVPILIENGASVYFKGYAGIYNFHSKEMLKDIFGFDLSSLWPIIEKTAISAGMAEKGYDGRVYVNSFMATALSKNAYFWNNTKQQYEIGEKGTPDAANFTGKYIDVGIPFTQITAGMWATITKTVDPASFSYYDMYDSDGSIKLSLIQELIPKITRKPIYF